MYSCSVEYFFRFLPMYLLTDFLTYVLPPSFMIDPTDSFDLLTGPSSYRPHSPVSDVKKICSYSLVRNLKIDSLL
jgi:hypothetical protein